MIDKTKVIYEYPKGEYYLVDIGTIRNDLDLFLSNKIHEKIHNLEQLYSDIMERYYVDEDNDYSSDKIRRFLGKRKGGIRHDQAIFLAGYFGDLLHKDKNYYITVIMEVVEFFEGNKLTDVNNYVKPIDDMKGVINNIRTLLTTIIDSNYFNFIPKSKVDGFDFYQEWIDVIDNGIYIVTLGNEALTSKLRMILKETEAFIRRYEIPGVCDRWIELNPKIRYFDPVFTFMPIHSDSYEKVKNSQHLNFRFYPTKREIQDRKNYFKNIQKENKLNNFNYSEDQIFKNELIKTFEIVVSNDLKDYL